MKKIFFHIFSRVMIDSTQFIYLMTMIILMMSFCYICWREVTGETVQSFKGQSYYQGQVVHIPDGSAPLVAMN
ncbi:MAG: hypothetical protein GY793_03265 [Proteobacteria bacterium]|nr:hypothetical protein [Pseudomonadota bacterium]